MNMFVFECLRQLRVTRRTKLTLSRQEVIDEIGEGEHTIEDLEAMDDEQLASIWIQNLWGSGVGLDEIGSEEDYDEDETFKGPVSCTIERMP